MTECAIKNQTRRSTLSVYVVFFRACCKSWDGAGVQCLLCTGDTCSTSARDRKLVVSVIGMRDINAGSLG